LHKICAAVVLYQTGTIKMRGINLATQKTNILSDWSTTMGSLLNFSPSIKRFHWDKYVSEFNVRCYGVEDLWKTYILPYEFNFLSTDLEGLDFEIQMKLLNLNILPFAGLRVNL